MEPAAFAHVELKKRLITITRAVDQAKQNTAHRKALARKAVERIAGGPARDEDEDEDDQRDFNPHYDVSFKRSPGVRVTVSPTKVPALAKHIEDVTTAVAAEKAACAERCHIAGLMETGELRRFAAFAREVRGKSPSIVDLTLALTDWIEQRRAHVCPT